MPVIAKLTDEAKLLITENFQINGCLTDFVLYKPASAAVTGIPLIRVMTVVKTPVHVPKKHPAEMSDPKTAWNEVIGWDILPQRPVIPDYSYVRTITIKMILTANNSNYRKNTVEQFVKIIKC